MRGLSRLVVYVEVSRAASAMNASMSSGFVSKLHTQRTSLLDASQS